MLRFLAALLLLLPLSAAELKVAALHPLLADLARQVGGDRVEVVDLVGQNGDPHHFAPAPADLVKAKDAKIYFASGMGLEAYLPSLRGVVGNTAEIVEVGKDFPALQEDDDHDHSGHDHHHTTDPHWWHSVDLFRRAAVITAETLSKADPAGAEIYQKNAAEYRDRLDELDRWVRKQIAAIPRDKRRLATAHAAFGYFCKDYGFQAIPIQGVNGEQMPSPKDLARLIDELKAEKVAALFPEKESNPKILQALTKDTGIKL
ncbi:MAG: zinc transporter substrate-binding protein, partial [Akkermansiaceae bacterium]|nr:zinc transporter substrate-binding protein [Akkermansiaceae bacterium]